METLAANGEVLTCSICLMLGEQCEACREGLCVDEEPFEDGDYIATLLDESLSPIPMDADLFHVEDPIPVVYLEDWPKQEDCVPIPAGRRFTWVQHCGWALCP